MAGAAIGGYGAWLVFTHMRVGGLLVLVVGIALLVWVVVSLFKRHWLAALLSLVMGLVLTMIGAGLFQAGSITKLTNGMFIIFEVIVYASLIAVALEFTPELILLDPGVGACIRNCEARPWEPHKYATKEEQDKHLAFLLAWVRAYYTRDGELSLQGHTAIYNSYPGPKRRIVELASGEQRQ